MSNAPFRPRDGARTRRYTRLEAAAGYLHTRPAPAPEPEFTPMPALPPLSPAVLRALSSLSPQVQVPAVLTIDEIYPPGELEEYQPSASLAAAEDNVFEMPEVEEEPEVVFQESEPESESSESIVLEKRNIIILDDDDSNTKKIENLSERKNKALEVFLENIRKVQRDEQPEEGKHSPMYLAIVYAEKLKNLSVRYIAMVNEAGFPAEKQDEMFAQAGPDFEAFAQRFVDLLA